MSDHVDKFLNETSEISEKIDKEQVNKVIERIKKV